MFKMSSDRSVDKRQSSKLKESLYKALLTFCFSEMNSRGTNTLILGNLDTTALHHFTGLYLYRSICLRMVSQAPIFQI